MMTDKRLIECPDCQRMGKKQILGSMLDNGDLLVLRFHHGTTLVRAPKLELICGCGYIFNFSEGTIVPQQI